MRVSPVFLFFRVTLATTSYITINPSAGGCPAGTALTEAECSALNTQTVGGKVVNYKGASVQPNPETCGCYFDQNIPNPVFFNQRTTDCNQADVGEIAICKKAVTTTVAGTTIATTAAVTQVVTIAPAVTNPAALVPTVPLNNQPIIPVTPQNTSQVSSDSGLGPASGSSNSNFNPATWKDPLSGSTMYTWTWIALAVAIVACCCLCGVGGCCGLHIWQRNRTKKNRAWADNKRGGANGTANPLYTQNQAGYDAYGGGYDAYQTYMLTPKSHQALPRPYAAVAPTQTNVAPVPYQPLTGAYW